MLKSYLSAFADNTLTIYRRWFHTRSIIIMSEQKVKHLPINGHLQFVVLVGLLGGLCWGTYSTDRFLTFRGTVKAQNQTIRSVASDRVNLSFGNVLRPAVIPSGRKNLAATLSDPMQALAGPDPKALYAHIAKLEQQVTQLKNNNEAIIQHVKEKTADNMEALQAVIKKTGLDENELKKVAIKNEKQKHTDESAAGEGGPFIPADMSDLPDTPETKEVFANLDQLALLRNIVGTLPLARPFANAEERSPFGHRVDPFTRRLAFHSGLDMAGPAGTLIHATGSGRVVSAGYDGSYGNAVDIDHGFGIVTRYGHMSKVLVTAGQYVTLGQVVGVQGSTGRSTGAHLHYEVRYHDEPLNPQNFLDARRYVSQN